MVATFERPETLTNLGPSTSIISLDTFLQHPLDNKEWIDNEIREKKGMTLRHSQIQLRLGSYWRNHVISSGQGGEVYTEALCRTGKQARRPDVAYLTPELLSEYGRAASLPLSFPLIGEIASPDDSAEELFAKAREYLESGCQEIWLVYPETSWLIIITLERHLLLTLGETATTQKVLTGLSLTLDELFA